jgi:hypothetical protein
MRREVCAEAMTIRSRSGGRRVSPSDSVFGRPGGGLTGLITRGGLHTRYPKLYRSAFLVPTATCTTLSAALFPNRISVTCVEKNDGADGKVS